MRPDRTLFRKGFRSGKLAVMMLETVTALCLLAPAARNDPLVCLLWPYNRSGIAPYKVRIERIVNELVTYMSDLHYASKGIS